MIQNRAPIQINFNTRYFMLLVWSLNSNVSFSLSVIFCTFVVVFCLKPFFHTPHSNRKRCSSFIVYPFSYIFCSSSLSLFLCQKQRIEKDLKAMKCLWLMVTRSMIMIWVISTQFEFFLLKKVSRRIKVVLGFCLNWSIERKL